MKRLVVAAMILSLSMSVVACGDTKKTNGGAASTGSNSITSTEQAAEVVGTESEEVVGTEAGTETGEELPEVPVFVEVENVGEALAEKFHEAAKVNPDATNVEIVDQLFTLGVFPFQGASMDVNEGVLTGFDNAEIKGFESGTVFQPMISTIPFVGYVFTIGESGDIDAFTQTLNDNANKAWNICTEAEDMVIETEGNKVLFVMSPRKFDNPTTDAGTEATEGTETTEGNADVTPLDEDLTEENEE